MTRVAILGGGLAGLTAAWRLSQAELRDHVDVVVYERGWTLGGKGASTRGRHGRIEEHGLHVWLGYYDNAFRLMREVYDELDRTRADPTCPIRTWRDAFSPMDRVGVEDDSTGDWSHWLATFSRNSAEPGDAQSSGSMTVAQWFARGLRLLGDFAASLDGEGRDEQPRVVLSSSPWHPDARNGDGGWDRAFGRLDAMTRRVVDDVVTTAVASDDTTFSTERLTRLARQLAGLSAVGGATLQSGAVAARRGSDLVGLVSACLLGAVRDDLLVAPEGFAAIDGMDFRAWLRRNGASERTCRSPLVRAMYDLAFAYEDGDPQRPAMCAGLGLFLAGKLFFDYKGSVVWRLEAGMGEAVVAPLYQVLAARGVEFRFFHRVTALQLNPERDAVESIAVARPVRLAPGVAEYRPLARVADLPCFPGAPLRDQLAGDVQSEVSPHRPGSPDDEVLLRAGVDFDAVVLAVPPAVIRSVGAELVACSPRWRDLVDRVASVPTQSLQVWLRETAPALGWDEPHTIVTGYVRPFESHAEMSHLIAREQWPADNPVRSVAYFCSVLPSECAADATLADEMVRANAERFLARDASHFWPNAATANRGFRWDVLWTPGGEVGTERLNAQYWRANVDPSDRYVQSLPGTSTCRLRADGSGYSNLFLAGDWINSGLNAGCIEAAVMSGVEASNAVLGRPLMEGVLGDWYGVPA